MSEEIEATPQAEEKPKPKRSNKVTVEVLKPTQIAGKDYAAGDTLTAEKKSVAMVLKHKMVKVI